MREHERRYRSSIGKSSSESQRERYRAYADKQSATNKNRQMTYDDYLAQVKDAEKIIEVTDDTRWDEIRENLSDYVEWVRTQVKKYTPIATAKVVSTAKGTRSKIQQSEHAQKAAKRALAKKVELDTKFGHKNVRYSAITGTAVLVLLGGFLLLRGGSGDPTGDSLAELGSVQGAGTAVEPTFDVAVPTDNPEDTEVLFDPELGVASYAGQVGDTPVTISQQPLTPEQKVARNTFLNEVATSLFAETSFDTQFGKTHIASEPDDTGDQVAVFMTENLLVFIRTRGVTIGPIEWIEYINNIKQ